MRLCVQTCVLWTGSEPRPLNFSSFQEVFSPAFVNFSIAIVNSILSSPSSSLLFLLSLYSYCDHHCYYCYYYNQICSCGLYFYDHCSVIQYTIAGFAAAAIVRTPLAIFIVMAIVIIVTTLYPYRKPRLLTFLLVGSCFYYRSYNGIASSYFYHFPFLFISHLLLLVASV